MNEIEKKERITNKGRKNRNLTLSVELEGENSFSAMELMRCVRELCGGLVACRFIGAGKYEVTMSHPKGKERLLEGFKMGETRVHARELCNDELVVSFLNLPFYTDDGEILEKLHGWGVSAVSPIKRRMWPGTKIADGTRFLKKERCQHKQVSFRRILNQYTALYQRIIHIHTLLENRTFHKRRTVALDASSQCDCLQRAEHPLRLGSADRLRPAVVP
ncbi:uncharacterized protein LOC130196718 [Pseudoliparis swirei]|uniref:uncharacterized protein LOC130196718 n=1 Tax=Pseudoliparis swirei TaxID=2059687 RepID=UPI0024BDE14B|nr:uncharacterized protein LOC130196718 [Pseudoliparis swirei]